MKETFQNIVAVACGVILLAGIVCCFFESDLIAGVLIMGVLYVFYIVALVKKRKRDAKKNNPPKGALRK